MVKYVLLVPLLLLLLYLLSFAKYNWTQKNRLAAVGVLILCLAAAALPVFVLFFGKYEL
jgi:hypothetical protein